MRNYYEILKVSPEASATEIKSAYRRLARKLHPDVNQGNEETALRFAEIAEAYEVLGNRLERSKYDRKLRTAQLNHTNGDSVFTSTNRHAQRWRQMVYEKRYNEIIDRMIAEERREATAMQNAVFPTVALFVSTLLVVIFRPKIFIDAAIVGKIVVVSLFIAGVIHIVGRLRDAFEHYTYHDEEIHESILDENEPKTKPYSRRTATMFLAAGLLTSFGLGLLIGHYVEFTYLALPSMFSESLKPEFVFYPPIVVLFVDMMHAFANRLEN